MSNKSVIPATQNTPKAAVQFPTHKYGYSDSENYYLNSKLLEIFGPKTSVYLANLIDKLKYFEDRNMLSKDGCFFVIQDQLCAPLKMSKHELRRCKKELIEAEIISTEMRGIPPKEYYSINFPALDQLLQNASIEVCDE